MRGGCVAHREQTHRDGRGVKAARDEAAELSSAGEVRVSVHRLWIVLARESNDLTLGELILGRWEDLADDEVVEVSCVRHTFSIVRSVEISANVPERHAGSLLGDCRIGYRMSIQYLPVNGGAGSR